MRLHHSDKRRRFAILERTFVELELYRVPAMIVDLRVLAIGVAIDDAIFVSVDAWPRRRALGTKLRLARNRRDLDQVHIIMFQRDELAKTSATRRLVARVRHLDRDILRIK